MLLFFIACNRCRKFNATICPWKPCFVHFHKKYRRAVLLYRQRILFLIYLYTLMKNFLLISMAVLLALPMLAQVPYNAAAPNGYTKKASVAEQVGLTEVAITYHRPAVNGREGKTWGTVVHKGFTNLGFGNGKPAPWRAGANENTVIEFDQDVKVEGQPLARGRYGFFIAYDPFESILIFSKRTDAWGSFFYEEREDALRVKVKPQPLEKSVEYLQYTFSAQTKNSATVLLSWEKLSIGFKVEVDELQQQYEAFVAESQNPRGFTSQGLNLAATWCLQNNYRLEKGLEWSTLAGSSNFPGDPTSFPALITKAAILDKLGRSAESATATNAALPFGTVVQLQQYGRQLLAAKNFKIALVVFQFNYDRHPNHFIALTGMARGLSANGAYAKALEYASKALSLAPNEAGKQAVESMIVKLEAGKDIN
jgi:tetratricopeptide (TPR) repeat protein